ncbi:PepSY domain-containing protein [Thermaurantiacus sp.]
MTAISRIITAFAMSALLAAPALADRRVSKEDKALIEAMLKAEGYTKWDTIEYIDGDRRIKVDDAIDARGQRHDLIVGPASFRVVEIRRR